MTEVSFSQMKDGTQADYEFLERLEDDHIRGLPDRIMNALAGLSDGLGGISLHRRSVATPLPQAISSH